MAAESSPADAGTATPKGQRKSPARPVWVLAAMLVVACAGGWAWWRFEVYPTTPQYAADRFLQAVRTRDYEAMYALVELPGPVKTVLPNAGALRRVADAAPGAIPTLDDYRITACRADGDSAKVDVSTTTSGGVGASEGAQTIAPYTVPMVRVRGEWRVDGGWIVGEMAKKGARALLRAILF